MNEQKPNGLKCQICGEPLTGRQKLYCHKSTGRKCQYEGFRIKWRAYYKSNNPYKENRRPAPTKERPFYRPDALLAISPTANPAKFIRIFDYIVQDMNHWAGR